MTAEETKALASRFVAAFNRATFAEDATWFRYGTLPPSGLWQGRDVIMDEFLSEGGRLFGPASPQFEITCAVAEPGVGVLECAASGTTASGAEYRMDTETWRALLVPPEQRGGEQTVN